MLSTYYFKYLRALVFLFKTCWLLLIMNCFLVCFEFFNVNSCFTDFCYCLFSYENPLWSGYKCPVLACISELQRNIRNQDQLWHQFLDLRTLSHMGSINFNPIWGGDPCFEFSGSQRRLCFLYSELSQGEILCRLPVTVFASPAPPTH